MVRIGFPGKALRVEPLLDTVWAIDPGAIAIGEGGEVIGFAPDEEAVSGCLEGIAVDWIVLFVIEAGADDGREKVVQHFEAEDELTSGGWRRGGGKRLNGEIGFGTLAGNNGDGHS